MKLNDIVRNLDAEDQDRIICVKRPWSGDSESLVVQPDEFLGIPQSIRNEGYDYFLEVSIANEVLSILKGKHATVDDRVNLLLYYAENDAYPSWVYDEE